MISGLRWSGRGQRSDRSFIFYQAECSAGSAKSFADPNFVQNIALSETGWFSSPIVYDLVRECKILKSFSSSNYITRTMMARMKWSLLPSRLQCTTMNSTRLLQRQTWTIEFTPLTLLLTLTVTVSLKLPPEADVSCSRYARTTMSETETNFTPICPILSLC